MQLYLKKIGLIIALLFVTALPSFATSTWGSAYINGQWVYGVIISDKGTTDNGDGTITILPPWSFVSKDGKTIIGNCCESGNLPWKYSKNSKILGTKVKLEINNSTGVTIKSEDPFFAELYEVVSGKKVFDAYNQNELNIKPVETLEVKTSYILKIVDSEGITEYVEFIIGENSAYTTPRK